MADNDLLAGNILQMQTAGAPPTGAAGGAGGAGGVRFIDFEYAGPNYRGAETLTIITIIGWSAGVTAQRGGVADGGGADLSSLISRLSSQRSTLPTTSTSGRAGPTTAPLITPAPPTPPRRGPTALPRPPRPAACGAPPRGP